MTMQHTKVDFSFSPNPDLGSLPSVSDPVATSPL